MSDPTDPLTQRLVELGTELTGHVDWLYDQLVQAEIDGMQYQARDERVLHWRAVGRAAAYREVLTTVFRIDRFEIYRRKMSRADSAAS